MNNRIQALDGLRGIAALVVVLYHYFFRYNELYGYDGLNSSLFSWGHYGVELFFLISGFVIYFSANRSQVTVKSFAISRFFRLYPTYWVCLIVTFSVVSIFGLEGREVELKTAIINIVMFQNYLGIKSVDGVYWTLAVELNFYFWIALALWRGQLSNLVYIFSFICLISIFTLNAELLYLKVFNTVFFLYYLPFFVVGMSVYLIQSKLDLKQGLLGILVSVFTLCFTRDVDVVLPSLVCLLVFFSAISISNKLFELPFLKFLGLVSYPLYLIHQNIGYVIIGFVNSKVSAEIISVLCAIIVSVFSAWVIHVFVEKKLTKNLRDRANNFVLYAR